MKIVERIPKLNQLEITLWAIFPYVFGSLGFNIYYIIQGRIWVSSGYSDYYYGNYFTANGDGSLLMDILLTVLLTAVLIVIGLAIRKRQRSFLLLAAAFLLISMPISQLYLGCVGSIIICIFGFFQMRKEQRNDDVEPKGKYILTVTLFIYLADAILVAVQLGNSLLAIGGQNTNPGGYESTVPDWLTWGTGATNTDVNFFFIIGSLLPSLLLLVTPLFMFLAISGRGYIWCRLAAIAFLLYAFFIMIPVGKLLFSGQTFFLPEALLSIYLLFRLEPKKAKLPVEQSQSGEDL